MRRSIENASALQRLCIQIIYTRIDCAMSLALLTKEILDEAERFIQCKDYLKSEYDRAREALRGGEDLPKVVFSTLKAIEMFFGELGSLNELSPLLAYPENR